MRSSETMSNISNDLNNEAQRAAGKAEGMLSSASREIKDLISDVEDFIKAGASLSGADLEKAKQKLSSRVTAAKESVEHMGSNVAERARKTAAATNDYVNEQPWTAVGVGAAVGFLLGFVISRRN